MNKSYQQISESSELEGYKNETHTGAYWESDALGKLYARWNIWNNICENRNYMDSYSNAIAQEYLTEYKACKSTIDSATHSFTEIKSANYNVQQRNLVWLNEHLEEARKANNGEYDDMPLFKQTRFDNYESRLRMVHINSLSGSKLVYKK